MWVIVAKKLLDRLRESSRTGRNALANTAFFFCRPVFLRTLPDFFPADLVS
jgi:hypothetical protein